jgi:hypothetical protein
MKTLSCPQEPSLVILLSQKTDVHSVRFRLRCIIRRMRKVVAKSNSYLRHGRPSVRMEQLEIPTEWTWVNIDVQGF